MQELVVRAVGGALAALFVASVAVRLRALSRSGAIAAVLLGTVAAMADPRWAILLITYFLVTSALSQAGRRAKSARVAAIVSKGGARDARQVAANGAVFGVAACGALLMPDAPVPWALAATGALTASASDTWATEIGTWIGGVPRSIRTGRPVAAGTSGAITLAGSVGMVAGAAIIASIGVALVPPEGSAVAVASWLTVSGVGGAMVDTLVGAFAQSRRWCPTCQAMTEQEVHLCGTRTSTAGGAAWIDNDVVNALCTVVGALIAAAPSVR